MHLSLNRYNKNVHYKWSNKIILTIWSKNVTALVSICLFFVCDKESLVKSLSPVWLDAPVINESKTANRHLCVKADVYGIHNLYKFSPPQNIKTRAYNLTQSPSGNIVLVGLFLHKVYAFYYDINYVYNIKLFLQMLNNLSLQNET